MQKNTNATKDFLHGRSFLWKMIIGSLVFTLLIGLKALLHFELLRLASKLNFLHIFVQSTAAYWKYALGMSFFPILVILVVILLIKLMGLIHILSISQWKYILTTAFFLTIVASNFLLDKYVNGLSISIKGVAGLTVIYSVIIWLKVLLGKSS